MMREEQRTSLIRGTATGALSGAIVLLTTLGTTGDLQASAIAGGIAGLTALGSFFGLGVADAKRNDAAAKP